MAKIYQLPPTERTIIPPEGGWKQSTYYKVYVSHKKNNPIHFAFFYSGFLNTKGQPGSYNQAWNPTWDYPVEINDLYYLEVVEKLFGKENT